jgi:hypothetical protein
MNRARDGAGPRSLPTMALACCYLAAAAPGARLAPHAAKHASASAGAIWATDVPGWVTAIATVGLLIGAIITARYAIRAFGKQSDQLEDQRKVNAKQTEVLELQAEELRES